MLKLLDKIDLKRGKRFEDGTLFEGKKYAIEVHENWAWLYKKMRKARGGP